MIPISAARNQTSAYALPSFTSIVAVPSYCDDPLFLLFPEPVGDGLDLTVMALQVVTALPVVGSDLGGGGSILKTVTGICHGHIVAMVE